MPALIIQLIGVLLSGKFQARLILAQDLFFMIVQNIPSSYCTQLAPPVLVAKGDVELLNKQCVSIVGSRRASLQALKMSANLPKILV